MGWEKKKEKKKEKTRPNSSLVVVSSSVLLCLLDSLVPAVLRRSGTEQKYGISRSTVVWPVYE